VPSDLSDRVRYVVEGSVRKGGERVRITVHLNDVATGSHIRAERYYRNLADVFAVQDEITHAIVAMIEPQLTSPRISAPSASHRTAWMPGTWSCGPCPTTGASLGKTRSSHRRCSKKRSPLTRTSLPVAQRAALVAVEADNADPGAH
jgi:hypothetical protein